MNGFVVAIGDELTSGVRLDTNSQWISQRLGEIGVEVIAHATAADQRELCAAVFRDAIDRADVVVATGGLGPTADDLTREAIADATQTQLVLDEQALSQIADRYARRGRTMPERNRRQAYFPAGSQPITNPHGTAPGVWFTIEREGRPPCLLFALPGVPAELFEMWAETVEPAIVAASPSARVITHRRIKCFGVGESDLEQMLPDLIRRGRHPTVGITVHEATITLRITAAGASVAACRTAMETTEQEIHRCLGDLVFGYEDDELQHVVAAQLAESGQSVATVEVGSAGLLGRWLADASATSDCFAGGMVLRDIRDSGRLLGDTAAEASAAALAQAARDRFETDFAIVIGPATGDDASPEVEIALASAAGVQTQMFSAGGHPAIRRPRLAKQALNFLRLAGGRSA